MGQARIIKDKFHVNGDGSLCLGAWIEVKRKFSQNPTLLGFTEDLLIPFLYSYKVWDETGETPYGELSHGIKGIIEYYENFFSVKGLVEVLQLLKVIADDDYRGHLACPCNSGKKLRNCHGKKLLEIKKFQLPEEFLNEYILISKVYFDDTNSAPPKSCTSKSLMKKIKKKMIKAAKEAKNN